MALRAGLHKDKAVEERVRSQMSHVLSQKGSPRWPRNFVIVIPPVGVSAGVKGGCRDPDVDPSCWGAFTMVGNREALLGDDRGFWWSCRSNLPE